MRCRGWHPGNGGPWKATNSAVCAPRRSFATVARQTGMECLQDAASDRQIRACPRRFRAAACREPGAVPARSARPCADPRRQRRPGARAGQPPSPGPDPAGPAAAGHHRRRAAGCPACAAPSAADPCHRARRAFGPGTFVTCLRSRRGGLRGQALRAGRAAGPGAGAPAPEADPRPPGTGRAPAPGAGQPGGARSRRTR